MENNVYFISGIDTDAGKSYCTAYYACELIRSVNVLSHRNSSKQAIAVILKI